MTRAEPFANQIRILVIEDRYVQEALFPGVKGRRCVNTLSVSK